MVFKPQITRRGFVLTDVLRCFIAQAGHLTVPHAEECPLSLLIVRGNRDRPEQLTAITSLRLAIKHIYEKQAGTYNDDSDDESTRGLLEAPINGNDRVGLASPCAGRIPLFA